MKIEQEIIYQCDICSKQSRWIKGEWIAHVFLVQHDEYEFHLCSDECDEKLLSMSKNDRRKLYYDAKLGK